jgi:hypothetical protein
VPSLQEQHATAAPTAAPEAVKGSVDFRAAIRAAKVKAASGLNSTQPLDNPIILVSKSPPPPRPEPVAAPSVAPAPRPEPAKVPSKPSTPRTDESANALVSQRKSEPAAATNASVNPKVDIGKAEAKASPQPKVISLKAAEKPSQQAAAAPAQSKGEHGAVNVDASVVEAMGSDRASKLAVYIDTTRRMLLDILGQELFRRVYQWVKHDLQGSGFEGIDEAEVNQWFSAAGFDAARGARCLRHINRLVYCEAQFGQ